VHDGELSNQVRVGAKRWRGWRREGQADAVPQSAYYPVASAQNDLCRTYGFHGCPASSALSETSGTDGRQISEPSRLDFIAHYEDRMTTRADHRHALDGPSGGEKR